MIFECDPINFMYLLQIFEVFPAETILFLFVTLAQLTKLLSISFT